MTTKTNPTIPSLTQYSLLGRSGLRVSPLCLGTMTFGKDWGWGCDEATSNAIFQRFLEAGGNFVDTADVYTEGRSEEFIGRFMKERNNRDRIVLATKYSLAAIKGDPNGSGNSRKNMLRSVESSLKRLQTDYIDLYWMHAWDGLTPIEEVLVSMESLVHSGKVRYIGMSDTPAWYAARMQTLSERNAWTSISALQLEYSLLERNIENEHIPMALELGMGVCPWSPLGGGLLSGKYKQKGSGVEGSGRIAFIQEPGNPFVQFTKHDFEIADTVVGISKELNKQPAQIALNWITRRPGVSSTLIGATTLEQLETNLSSLEFEIPHELNVRLEEISRPEAIFPYTFFQPTHRERWSGGTTVTREPKGYRGTN